jgi:YfiH family protein
MLTLRAGNLSSVHGVAHGFFGRTGGVSQGVYASLNCALGTQDFPEAVAENRRRALAALAGKTTATLLSLYQAHTPDVVTVREPWETPKRPRADAMVTDRAGIALGIVTADCAPVLFADSKAHIIGAAHAGWKGALGGVLEATVTAMKGLGSRPENIRAAIGPCISQAAYEVGPEFIARFCEADPDNTRFFVPSPRDGHWQFDLKAYVAARLARAGVGSIEPLGTCTYAREADFFSYRRATHRKEVDFGHQLSAIMLSP